MTHSQNDIARKEKVRPERFITDRLNGLTIPIEVNGVLTLMCCLRSREGHPHVIRLSERQEFEGIQLICEPYDSKKQVKVFEDSWSLESRRDWYYFGEPADPDGVFTRLVATIKRSVDFSPGDESGPEIWSLWIIMTYFAPLFNAVPYLHLYGNKASGKSTGLDILSKLVFRPFDAVNVSPASVYNWTHFLGGTLLLDEAEQFEKQSEMGRVLNAGYKQGGKVRRANNLEGMQVFGPKVLASIRSIDETLASRCIRFTMTPTQKELLPLDQNDARRLRDDLHVIALDFGFDLLETRCEGQILDGLKNRQKDLWEPLLIIAQWLERKGVEGLTDRIRHAAADVRYASVDVGLQPEDETLLNALAQLVRTDQRVRPRDVLDEAKAQNAHLFAEQKWTPQIAANHLSRLGVPATVKSNGDRVYRVTESYLSELMTRHGMTSALPLDDRLTSDRSTEFDDDDDDDSELKAA